MGTTYGPNPNSSQANLELCVDFSNSKMYAGTGTTITSLTGSVGNGTLVGAPTFTSGTPGYITTTDTQYISYPNVFESQSITVISWVYPTSLTSTVAGTAARIVSRDRSDYWMLGLENGGAVEWSIYNSGGFSYWLTQTAVFEINTWQQIVGTYDGSTGDRLVYKNGEVIAVNSTSTATTIGNGASRPIAINTNVEATPLAQFGMPGRHGMHFVYSKALTADDVLQNFEAHKGRFGL